MSIGLMLTVWTIIILFAFAMYLRSEALSDKYIVYKIPTKEDENV